MFKLNSNIIFDLLTHLWSFQIRPEMKTKWESGLWHQFYHKNHQSQFFWNVPLDALMCPLHIINYCWTPIIYPSWCKCTLYPPTIKGWKLSAVLWLLVKSFKQKKFCIRTHIFTSLCLSEFKIQMAKKFHWMNLTSGNSALNGQANGSVVIYSKIQNRICRAP